MFKAVAFTVLLIALAKAVPGQDQPTRQIVLKDLSGRTVSLASYRGKVVLLNFWATWCPPCRAEMPDLVKWQRQYRGKGLQVVGITYPPTRVQDVRRFARQVKVNYPILLGTRKTKARFDSSDTLPLTIIIDRHGNVKDRIEGILLPEEFEQKIVPLLN